MNIVPGNEGMPERAQVQTECTTMGRTWWDCSWCKGVCTPSLNQGRNGLHGHR